MKFKCNQSVLTKALNIVSKAVTSRTTIPILKGILLEVSEEGILKMSSSDLDITIEDTIEIEELLKFWNRMAEGGRKSFRYDELDVEFFLKETPGVFIPYLEALQKDLEQR